MELREKMTKCKRLQAHLSPFSLKLLDLEHVLYGSEIKYLAPDIWYFHFQNILHDILYTYLS